MGLISEATDHCECFILTPRARFVAKNRKALAKSFMPFLSVCYSGNRSMDFLSMNASKLTTCCRNRYLQERTSVRLQNFHVSVPIFDV